MGAGVGVAYYFWAGVKEDSYLTHIGWFMAGLFALYTVCCVAMGIAISSLVAGVRSAVYLLMFIMTLLILLSDVPMILEELGGVGRVFQAISYLMPSRYCSGAWAAGTGFEPPGTSRGWTWYSSVTNIQADVLGLAGLTALFLWVATLRVRHEAPKHAD
jgi:hypothetical protein